MDLSYFYKGAISGSTGLLLSHPIDTIKSNVQKGTPINWSIKYLYRGVIPPFLGVGLEKALVFGSYSNVCFYLSQDNYYSYKHSIAGACSGFVASFIVTPIERIKILRQTNTNGPKSLNLSTLYRGFSNTFSREMPGFAIYFTVYEQLKTISQNPTSFHYFYMGVLVDLFPGYLSIPKTLSKPRFNPVKIKRYYQ
jgi:solute carrier family 25 carnitine/acylcarnitine transporter 20/29